MKIQNVTDASFRKYGKVLEGYDFSALLKEMKHTPVPDDVVYVPSVEELEALLCGCPLRTDAVLAKLETVDLRAYLYGMPPEVFAGILCGTAE